MDKPSYKLVGAPCGQHGQYTFYKAIRLTGEKDKIVAIGDFFFLRIWQDSELVSIGELQLLWTDRSSDQTLVSLRLYFLPENTPDGRGLHGEDEVLAISDKVVLRAEDLLSWVCDGSDWRWGLRAVWRGACAPPADARHSAPLHQSKLDFSDVEREKSAIVDTDSPGVVVFSYPRYCRYRALLSRLEGVQGDWLRDSLVAALGGYAAPTNNTRILYCKDTFEYPELEGHEFVCNHLAPRLKGRPRGRRRRPARSRSHSPSPSPSSRSSDSDVQRSQEPRIQTPRRLSLRNGADKQSEEEEESKKEMSVEDKAFIHQLRQFYKDRNEPFKMGNTLKDLSLRALYTGVVERGGYEAVCRHKLWRTLAADQPARTRRHYERFLLPYENHERRNGLKKLNGRIEIDPRTIDTIEVADSPLREVENKPELPEKRLRTPSPPAIDNETGEVTAKEEFTSKPAEELNREFLDSLQKENEKYLSVKPLEKLNKCVKSDIVKLFEDNHLVVNELAAKHNLMDSSKVIDEISSRQLSESSSVFLSELAVKLNLGNKDALLSQDPPQGIDMCVASVASVATVASSTSVATAVNGHSNGTNSQQQGTRPAGRSSLRAVRVKPARPSANNHTTPTSTHQSTSPPSLNNFGIHHPPLPGVTPTVTPTVPPTPTRRQYLATLAIDPRTAANSDDEIVEVPYKPKTPEIIDLDEYPESPQAVKKKKLDILKERGLEVTAVPTIPPWPVPPVLPTAITPLINPAPIMLNPAMQHQIMTQAQLFQMYNIIPPNYTNGVQPPKVIQATSIFGSSGPQKTVYGNPKDPFMPPPHVLLGTPVKPQRVQTAVTPPQDILDLTCKTPGPQKPAVEIVRVPTTPSPSKNTPQNLSAKNYTMIDGKAVVGSNLEITLVNPKTPSKNRIPKRSSNGKFVTTPTPPKEYPKYSTPSPSGVQKKSSIVIPNYQINQDEMSPNSTSSRDTPNQNIPFKTQMNPMMDMKTAIPFMDPYMSNFYSNLAGQMDPRQLNLYRELISNQFRGYSGLLNIGAVANTPTTKN